MLRARLGNLPTKTSGTSAPVTLLARSETELNLPGMKVCMVSTPAETIQQIMETAPNFNLGNKYDTTKKSKKNIMIFPIFSSAPWR